MKTYTEEEAIRLMKANPRSEWKNPYIAKIANAKVRWNADTKQFEFDCNEGIVDDLVWARIDESNTMFTNVPGRWYPLIPPPDESVVIEREFEDIHAAYSWMGTVIPSTLGIVNNKPFTLRIEQEVVK